MVDNILSDPFLERLGNLAIAPGLFGTWVQSDSSNPFGGGSISATTALIRIYRALPKGAQVGDDMTIRVLAEATGAVPSHYFAFVNAAGSTIPGSDDAVAGTTGVHDVTMNAEIPATAVGIRVEMSGASGKIFAVAASLGAATPDFVLPTPDPDLDPIPSALAGETVVLFGDSVIANTVDTSGPSPVWTDTALAELLQCNVRNFALGGTTMAARSDVNYSAISMTALADAIASNNWTAQDAAATALGGLPATKIPLLKKVDWSSVTAVFIAYGTNDYAAEQKALGSVTDTTGATFRGAVNNIVAKLQGTYPHLQIIFQTPIYRDRFGGGPTPGAGTGSISGTTLTVTSTIPGYTFVAGQTLFARQGLWKRTNIVSQLTGPAGGAGTYQVDRAQTLASTAIYGQLREPGDTKTNSQGLTLTAYADAIQEMAKRNSLPVLDAYRESGLNAATVTLRSEDGVHPSPRVGLYDLAKFIARGLAAVVR